MTIFDKKFLILLGLFILADIISIVAFFFWPLNVFICVIIFAIVFWLTLRHIEYGIYLALVEAVIGGLGYLFFMPVGEFRLSIRLIIFGAVMLAWLVRLIFEKNYRIFDNKYIWSLVPFLVCLFFGILAALISQRDLQGIFLDANNYLYLGLIFPAVFSQGRIKWDNILKIILAGSMAVAIKTAVVLFVFSHKLAILHDQFYVWLRDTGIGEIALIKEPLFRIFFQSHFYNLIAFVIILVLLFSQDHNRRQKLWLTLSLWLNFLALLISQSKTFWLAMILGVGLLTVWLAKEKAYRRIVSIFLVLACCLIMSHLALNLLINDFRINLFYSRLNEGDASAGVSSRSAQIAPALTKIIESPFFGFGFHQTITYKSSDPRVKNQTNPEGWYTTDALELGYLDIVLKLGLIGLLSYGCFLLLLLINTYKKISLNIWRLGLVIGLVLLLFVHALTPYLNHPLGISYLIILVSLL